MTAAGFKNLGDLIVRDRDLAKTAIIDLGGEQGPREFTFAQLDATASGVAWALGKRGLRRGVHGSMAASSPWNQSGGSFCWRGHISSSVLAS